MQIVFRNPSYLWTLLVIPITILVHFISLRYSKKRAIKFVNFITLARISEKVGITSNFSILFVRIFVFVVIVFSIAGTTLWYSGNRVDADYVIAIDVSSSMLADDFSPSRLGVAKTSSIDFVEKLPIYSSVGVVSFAGTSYINQPLTKEKSLVKENIKNIQTMGIGGTDLGDAIVTGSNLLINSNKPRVIILLTDGRSNIGLSIGRAIEYANENNVIINTIGLGAKEGYSFELKEDIGQLGINEEELKLIANFTKGSYYHFNSTEELKGIYNMVAESKKTKVSLDLTFFLLITSLVLLVLEWVLINTRFRVIP